MSLWFLGRNQNGRRALYSFGLHPVHLVFLLMLLFGMLVLPIVRFLRDLLP